MDSLAVRLDLASRIPVTNVILAFSLGYEIMAAWYAPVIDQGTNPAYEVVEVKVQNFLHRVPVSGMQWCCANIKESRPCMTSCPLLGRAPTANYRRDVDYVTSVFAIKRKYDRGTDD